MLENSLMPSIVSSTAIQIENDDDAVLHVGNLDRQVTSDQLYNALQAAAPVVSITVPRHRDAEHCGYAIVRLTSARAAKAAIVTCSKLELGGRRIILWAQSSALCPHHAHIKGSDTLLFDNLAFSTTEATLYEFASTAGTVQRTHIVRDRITNKSLGYGYVQMESAEQAARALVIFRDPHVDSHPCRVSSCLPPLIFT